MDQGPLVMNTTTARVFASVAVAAIAAAAAAAAVPVAEGAFARWTVLIECSKGGDQSQRVLLLLSAATAAAAAASEKFPLISFAQATSTSAFLQRLNSGTAWGGRKGEPLGGHRFMYATGGWSPGVTRGVDQKASQTPG